MASTSAPLRPHSSSAMSRMLIAMESSCMTSLGASRHHASPALPSDLDHLAVFQQYRNGPLACGFAHASERGSVGIYVEFDKVAAREFQPLAHFRRVRAAGRTEKFKHAGPLRSLRAACDRWKLALPECVEYSRSERSGG